MSGIYVRIFIIISRHQNSRRMNHEQSTLTRGAIDTVGSIGTATVVNLPELLAKTDAVRCAACAAQALRDDDDPTVSIVSGAELTRRESTKRNSGLADDVISSDQDGKVMPSGTSCNAATHRLEWNIIDQDRVVREDYKTSTKASISNWSQSNSASPNSAMHLSLDKQQQQIISTTINSSSRKTNEKDESENLFTTFLSDTSDVKHNPMSSSPSPLDNNKITKRCILFDDGDSGISQRRSLEGDQSYSSNSKTEYNNNNNNNCDQVNGKNQSLLLDDNKVMLQDNSKIKLRSTFEKPNCGSINHLIIPTSRIKSELQLTGEEDGGDGGGGGIGAQRLMSHLNSFNDTTSSDQANDNNAQGEESNLLSVECETQNGGPPLTKTVSLVEPKSFTNTKGCFVSSASLKLRKTSPAKGNANETRAPLEGQYSLGTMTSGFNDSCTNNKELKPLSLPNKGGGGSGSGSGSGGRLVSKQQARFKLQKAERQRCSFKQEREESKKKQQNTSVRLRTQPSSLSKIVRDLPSRDCTCGNKLGQFNAKLSRSNTIGDHSNNASLNYKSNTNRTIVTMSGSQRSSISSAFTPSSIRSKLRRSPTSGSLGTNIQADYRSSNNARQLYNSMATNITASSSIYEPQRRHIHASAVPQTNTKALITTLLILGTYFISYVPAIIYQVLTCVDHCPYPLYTLSFSRRVFFGAMTTLLLIAKSIIDPFIYSYRMSEIQLAINRYLSKRKSKSSLAASLQTSQRLTNASCLNNNNNNYNYNSPQTFHQQAANQYDQTDLINLNKVKHPISSSKILNGNDGASNDRTGSTPPSTVLKLRSQPIKEQPVQSFKRSESKRDHINTDHQESIGFASSKRDSNARGVIKLTKVPLHTQLSRDQENKRMLDDSECEEEIENEANTGKLVCLNNASANPPSTVIPSTDLKVKLNVCNEASNIIAEGTSLTTTTNSVAAFNGRLKIFFKDDSNAPQEEPQFLKPKGLVCDDI